MKKVIMAAVLAATVCTAESHVMFETDFSELPEGWLNDEWTFDHPGAYTYGYTQDDYWSARMYSSGSSPSIYFVPDGTDSVVVHIEHDLILYGDPTAYGRVFVSSTTFGDATIYDFQLTPPYTFMEDIEPIHWVLEDPPQGTWLGFEFRGVLSTYSQLANSLSWTVTSLTVTACGSELSLPSCTWGEIKSILR